MYFKWIFRKSNFRLYQLRENYMIDYDSIKDGMDALKQGISVIKGIKDLLPDGQNKDKVNKKIEEAERLLKIGDAKVAQELGYSLCKCTFPPQIMIENEVGKNICTNCGKIEGESSSQDSKELSVEKVDILMALLEVGEKTIELRPLASKLQINEKKLHYYLVELSGNDFVQPHYNIMHPTRYELGHYGTQYLIEIGAL